MSDPLTYKYEIDLGDRHIRGECEFNTDEQTTFSITESSAIMPYEMLDWLNHFFEFASELYHGTNGIQQLVKLSIKKKEA